MNLSPVFQKQFKNTVERILHVPGNFTGPVLEMAVVIDKSLKKEQVQAYLPALLKMLKMHSDAFRNVRLNVVFWHADGHIQTETFPMSKVMIDSFYENYESRKQTKTLEGLVDYLKMYQARSKLIILLTDGSFQIADGKMLAQAMQPFLFRKLMQVVLYEDGTELKYRFAETV